MAQGQCVCPTVAEAVAVTAISRMLARDQRQTKQTGRCYVYTTATRYLADPMLPHAPTAHVANITNTTHGMVGTP